MGTETLTDLSRIEECKGGNLWCHIVDIYALADNRRVISSPSEELVS
jgi:hypothetical protein